MALQVWLPLNGDLYNQGLDASLTVMSGTPSWLTYGKISNTGLSMSSRLTGTSNAMNGAIKWSVCFWFNTASSTTLTDNWVDLCGMTDISTGGSSGQFRFEACYGSSLRACSWHDNATNATINGSVTIAADNEKNTWHHACVTTDETNVKTYKDGVLIHTYTTGAGGHLNGYFWLGETNKIVGCIQDFRLYDHALSIKEVEEISKGLVIHYKLDDQFLESTTNLITTEDGLSNTCYNGATSKYNYGTATDMYKTVGTFQGKFCTKVYMGTAGNAAYPYVYFDPFNAKGTEIQTVSFDYFPTIQNTLIAYSYNGTYNFSYTSNYSDKISSNNVSQIIIPVNVNQWNHITITAQKYDTTNTSRGIGYIRIGSASHTSTTTNYWLFANIQVENKDHATGYVGVGRSNIATTIYDSSGYNNNGSIIDSLEIITPSPRYNYAVLFNGSSSAIKVLENKWMAQHATEMTINIWVKNSSWNNGANMKFFSCTESGGFNCEAGNSGYVRFPIYVCTNAEQTTYAYKYDSKEIQVSALTANDWNMITFVYNSAGTKTYINGQLHHTYTNTSYGIRFNTNARLFLGCEANTATPSSPYYNGQMSDFRLYYTALTAEQIKELYKDSLIVNGTNKIPRDLE